MSYSVTNKRTNSSFLVEPEESILDAALRVNKLYSYGCRNGVCGACKCDLISGSVNYGKHDEFALSSEEKSNGKVLICQATPLEDVEIDAEERQIDQSLKIKMLPCRVSSLKQLAPDVMQLFLSLPKSQTFDFLPGQYIDIVLRDGQRRSFSIGNLPENANKDGLELHVRNVSQGRFTNMVFNSLREKDLLRLQGPFGSYIFQTNYPRPIIMVAGGTGFAPIKGLFEQAILQNPDHHVHLFWGARNRSDLYMDSVVQKWKNDYNNFKYTPVLSENTDEDWQGASGFVHESLCEEYHDFSNYDIYSSGPPQMVSAVRAVVSERKMDMDRFFFDSFEFASITQS